ncbi:hypothetical protein QVD17_39035 [Tagetes erecta]|uniref:Uncharacterized protein n=1 Tax=Tagetes erecta TaxID=13708 RepID=A0AAD8NET6_TARER|nr:hypothetical protein QVD17_39035 [Tagetes erecta]
MRGALQSILNFKHSTAYECCSRKSLDSAVSFCIAGKPHFSSVRDMPVSVSFVYLRMVSSGAIRCNVNKINDADTRIGIDVACVRSTAAPQSPAPLSRLQPTSLATRSVLISETDETGSSNKAKHPVADGLFV